MIALGCSNPAEVCGHYPAVNVLRYVVMFIITATNLGLISMFVGRVKYGRSGQMDPKLFYLIAVFIFASTNVFFFTEVGRLDTKPTWRIFLTAFACVIGFAITFMLLRGDFKSMTPDREIEHMSTTELRDFVQQGKPRNRVVRRRAGRR